MISTLRDWRRVLRLTCICAIALSIPAIARAQQEPADHATQEVDAATKQLMAANGLFQRGLFKLAAQEYSDFLAANGSHPQATAARYALGVCRLRLGEHEKAIEALEPVARESKFEQRDDALAVLGYCQLVTKQYDKANDSFAELLDRYPKSKQVESAACYQAQALYLSGKFPAAARACEEFLRKYSSSDKRPAALYFLVLSQHAQNQHDKVLQTIAQLNRDHPDSSYKVDALLLAGQSLEAQGKLDAAIEQYRRMASVAPDARKPDACFSLGVALYKAGKYDEAARELTTVVNEYSKSNYVKPARLQLGLAQLAAHQTDEARRTLEQVARDDTARAADARYGLSLCDIADKKFESARAMLDTLVFLNPPPANLTQVLLDRAVCLMELGKYDEAAREFESLVSQHSGASQAPEAIYRNAFCLHKLAKYEQSHTLCERLAKLPKSDFSTSAAELDGENLFLLGKYDDAQRVFTSLAAGADSPQKKLRFVLRQGQCEYYTANYAKAVEILRPLSEDPNVEQSDELRVAIFLCGDALLQQAKNAEAAEMLKRYVTSAKGDKAEAMFKLAHAELAAGKSDEAQHTFADLTQGPADSPWVQRGLLEYGQVLFNAKQHDRAASTLQRLLDANAPAELSAPAIYLLGWIDFDAKRFEQAAEQWKKLTDKYAGDKLAADAAFQRGVALKDAGKLDESLDALQSFAASHADHPNATKARQLSAAILTAHGKHEQAGQILAELARDPKASDTILYDLSWSQRNSKNAAGAQETYRRLLSLHADSTLAPAACTELAELLYDDKKYSEAAELLERVAGEKSADSKVAGPALYRLGFCYEKLNQWDKAAVAFSDFADRFGDDAKLAASALLQAGVAFGQQGKFDRAESMLSRMLEKYSSSDQAPIAMLKLGEAQAERQEYDASCRTYRKFLDTYKKNDFAYLAQFGIAWAQENLKQFVPAREEYKKVLGLTNGETAARAQFQIGETYLAEQKFEQAIPALLAVEDVYAYPKWSARALLEAGRAFEQLKQPDRAKQQYTQLVTKYKNAPEAELAQERMRAL